MLLRTLDSRKLMMLGMYCFVLGALARFLPRWTRLNVDVTDAVMGLFYGLAIGLMLLSLSLRRRQR